MWNREFENENEYLNFISRLGLPSDAGNVYQVIQTSKAFYSDFYKNKQFQYSDGSWAVYPDSGNGLGIQAAINGCKGGRNDYILVGTGNYNLAAALTLAGKSSVHLVGVNGGGYDVGTMGAAALTQTGNFENIIMSPYSEVTGFQIINKNGFSAVTWAATIWRGNLHHNYFHMVGGSDINIIDCSASSPGTNANAYGRICNNRFSTWVAGVLNSAIYCGLGGAVDVSKNQITVCNGMIMDWGIYNGTTDGITNDNIVSESGGIGATGGGTITVAIQINAAATAINNRCAVVAGQGLAGGTASHSFVDNRDGYLGGATPIET